MSKEMFDRDSTGKMGKQIVLPFSRAVEISIKSLKMRFWRSIITVMSIVLAIAFFSSILVNTTIVRALKYGPTQDVVQLEHKYDDLETLKTAHVKSLNASADSQELRNQIATLELKTGVVAADAAKEYKILEELLAGKRMVRDTVNLKLQGDAGDDPGADEQILNWLKDASFPATKGELTAHAKLAGAPENVLRTCDSLPEGSYQSDRDITEAVAAVELDKSYFNQFVSQLKAKDYWLISLALLVCFVGIVNAMLMSVTERFREIGTMKCLGALDSFIVKLFLLESVFQGAAGTAIGIVLGTLLSVLRAWWLYGGLVFYHMPIGGILLCMVLSQAVGTLLSVVASVFPARAAARMQPVDALRAEQ
ncbi:MAG TPA: FtsX-like permease family protein [Planctomycetota bacterium]|nr:FtsX-like permease family protein [Planctomycetota bacterium]